MPGPIPDLRPVSPGLRSSTFSVISEPHRPSEDDACVFLSCLSFLSACVIQLSAPRNDKIYGNRGTHKAPKHAVLARASDAKVSVRTQICFGNQKHPTDRSHHPAPKAGSTRTFTWCLLQPAALPLPYRQPGFVLAGGWVTVRLVIRQSRYFLRWCVGAAWLTFCPGTQVSGGALASCCPTPNLCMSQPSHRGASHVQCKRRSFEHRHAPAKSGFMDVLMSVAYLALAANHEPREKGDIPGQLWLVSAAVRLVTIDCGKLFFFTPPHDFGLVNHQATR